MTIKKTDDQLKAQYDELKKYYMLSQVDRANNNSYDYAYEYATLQTAIDEAYEYIAEDETPHDYAVHEVLVDNNAISIKHDIWATYNN